MKTELIIVDVIAAVEHFLEVQDTNSYKGMMLHDAALRVQMKEGTMLKLTPST